MKKQFWNKKKDLVPLIILIFIFAGIFIVLIAVNQRLSLTPQARSEDCLCKAVGRSYIYTGAQCPASVKGKSCGWSFWPWSRKAAPTLPPENLVITPPSRKYIPTPTSKLVVTPPRW